MPKPHTYRRGEQALVLGSFEVVEVIAQYDMDVLVKRAGGQTTFSADQLEPYSDLCPVP